MYDTVENRFFLFAQTSAKTLSFVVIDPVTLEFHNLGDVKGNATFMGMTQRPFFSAFDPAARVACGSLDYTVCINVDTLELVFHTGSIRGSILYAPNGGMRMLRYGDVNNYGCLLATSSARIYEFSPL